MIAMIFEVWPKMEHKDDYINTAARLLPVLESMPGFISNERFESLTNPGKILSLAFFEDDTAIAAWRNRPEHRAAQEIGRTHYFSDYRLRIAEVHRDYGMADREQAPADSREIRDR